jgi:hypothetical protein
MRGARSVPSSAAEELLNLFLHYALGDELCPRSVRAIAAIAAAKKEASVGAQVSQFRAASGHSRRR